MGRWKREGDARGENVKGIGWEARKEKREDERVGSWEEQRG